MKETPSKESTSPFPSFVPYPDTSKDYDFKDEVALLPFQFN